MTGMYLVARNDLRPTHPYLGLLGDVLFYGCIRYPDISLEHLPQASSVFHVLQYTFYSGTCILLLVLLCATWYCILEVRSRDVCWFLERSSLTPYNAEGEGGDGTH